MDSKYDTHRTYDMDTYSPHRVRMYSKDTDRRDSSSTSDRKDSSSSSDKIHSSSDSSSQSTKKILAIVLAVVAALSIGLGVGLTALYDSTGETSTAALDTTEEPTTTLAPDTTKESTSAITLPITTPLPTTAVTTIAPRWEGFRITKFAPEHELSVLKDGINGWLTGNFIYYGIPDYLTDMAYLKSVKVIPEGTDITIEYEPKTAVGAMYFLTPLMAPNKGWVTDDDAKSGDHMRDLYGFEELPSTIYYVNEDTVEKKTLDRRIWKKEFDGSGILSFKTLTMGFSCSIAFEINKLCPTCAET